LLALLVAQRANDSATDAGRIALMSMVIKPPMMGLLFAVMMAKQAAPAPAAVLSTNTGTGTSTTAQGTVVLNQVAPNTDLHSFFPSFIKFTKNQATEFAKELRLKVKFVEGTGTARSKEFVTDQDPAPGADWPADRVVTLDLG
jgi:hypothetical protein